MDSVEAPTPGGGVPWPFRVWAAILRRAVVDLILYQDHEDEKLRQLGAEARKWISGEMAGHTAFETMCSHMGLDPELVRDKIKTMPAERVRALRGLDFDDG